ncbi:unnamed protein product [Brachionus calyciflorus]|uniref:DNA-3-methyladenine glycosylase n=1 Tax=Brachionus calyciflorus TaxID=104777 RepID=A0A813W0Z2_9BILA|nr:unnamed protein product [Brachionus calyciflorus]
MKRFMETLDDSNKKLKAEKPPIVLADPKSINRLKDDFFNQECLTLCKNLLGKYLIRRIDDDNKTTHIITKIVEVEAYTGSNDQASHSFNNKQTDRNKAMFMKAGSAYVYNIYGCYCCFNISSKEPGGGVLIRALEPIQGIDLMYQNRIDTIKGKNKKLNTKDLTNGPSKLCMAVKITKDLFNQVDLATSDFLWLQDKLDIDNEVSQVCKIIASKRIGIDYAGEEAINKLWRFYIKDNKFVSVKSKEPVEIDD